MDNEGIQLFSFCKKKVGDGKSTLLWDDIWLGDSSLRMQFPRVYALETDKSALVHDRLVLVDWDLVQRRAPRGGVEVSQMSALREILDTITISDQRDRWVWSQDGSGEFTVASARKYIDSKTLVVVHSSTRWNKFVPIKINIFTWWLSLNKLPTRDNLDKRGIDSN